MWCVFTGMKKDIICDILIVYNFFFYSVFLFILLPGCCCWFFKSWVKIIFWEFKMADSRWKVILQIFTFLIRFMLRNFYSFIVNYFYEKSFTPKNISLAIFFKFLICSWFYFLVYNFLDNFFAIIIIPCKILRDWTFWHQFKSFFFSLLISHISKCMLYASHEFKLNVFRRRMIS